MPSTTATAKQIDIVSKQQQKLEIKKHLLIEKAMRSNSPTDILKASELLKNINSREESTKKSFIIDPMEFNKSFGYKDKPFSLSYDTLKRMAKTPIINAIIKTRKNQVADFFEPQADKYSNGFIIRKKRGIGEEDTKTTKAELRRAEEIQNILLNCGVNGNWENDDFDTFGRKLVDDSLTYDQMTFEITRDRKGQIYEFFATDASTFRLADSFDDDEYIGNRKQIKGYFPSYVQVVEGIVESDFYPWEMCFGIRNPTTTLLNAGYGVSELEEIVSTVTSMLWGDQYNSKFFSQGSAPKGLLRIKGAVNEGQLQAFRQEWLSMVTGVGQSWKTPIVDGDVEWIDLHKSNRDMEYQSWMNYLIKIVCAIYCISPEEIGFDVSSGSSLFEGDKEHKTKASKDKGLYPLLKFLQRKLNKFLVSQIDPEYELLFVGLNGLTMQEELDMDIKKVQNFAFVNEIRDKYKMKDIGEDGDLILNPVFSQSKILKAQAKQMENEDDDSEETGYSNKPTKKDNKKATGLKKAILENFKNK